MEILQILIVDPHLTDLSSEGTNCYTQHNLNINNNNNNNNEVGDAESSNVIQLGDFNVVIDTDDVDDDEQDKSKGKKCVTQGLN